MAEVGEARLFVLAGPDLARSYTLGERSTLGRADECDVVLRDRSISRKHAEIVCEAQHWYVQDLGSTNGVTKDGQRGERFELADGDEFRLGDLPLRFKLLVAAEAHDIEFESGPVVSAPVVAARAPVPAPVAAPKPAVDEEPEVEIEEEVEIEIEGPDAPRRSAPLPAEATAFRPPRAARRTGFFAGDLEQQPFWMRCVIVVGVLVVGAGLAYGAFLAVQMLREGT